MPAARFPGLKVRTPASQAGDVGFKPRRSYCDHRIVAVKRTQFAMQICGSAYGAQDVRGTSVLRRPKRSGDRFPLVTPWMGMPSGEVAMVRWTMFSNDRNGVQTSGL